jgi:hypothetical protein
VENANGFFGLLNQLCEWCIYEFLVMVNDSLERIILFVDVQLLNLLKHGDVVVLSWCDKFKYAEML